jgi:type II secretory pathway component PulF
MANSARNGYSIAETMKKYPKLFSDSIISTVAVGEFAGQLPEACKQIQTHSEEALKYRRYFLFPILAGINLIFVLPLAYLLYRAVTRSFSDTFQGRAETSPGAVIQIFLDTAIWQVGPWAILFLLTVGGIYIIWRSDKLRPLRHKISATLPPYRQKARSENMERFSWALGAIMRTGAAPKTAWEIAAQTPQNCELRARFESIGDSMTDQTSLSEAMYQNPLFPEDYAMLMNTGEKTGAIVHSLDQFQRLSKTEMEAANRRAILRGTSLGCLGLILASGVFAILFALAFYREIPSEVMRWMDDSLQ